jgi:hypothetical protein
MFYLFFKSSGLAPIHKVDKDKTIDHNCYIENCLNSIINEIRKQETSSRTKCVRTLHDNGRSHNHRDLANYLTEESIEIMTDPPYSPDLAAHDFRLNDYIKSNLVDHTNEESLAEKVSKIVKNIPEKEFNKTFDRC